MNGAAFGMDLIKREAEQFKINSLLKSLLLCQLRDITFICFERAAYRSFRYTEVWSIRYIFAIKYLISIY